MRGRSGAGWAARAAAVALLGAVLGLAVGTPLDAGISWSSRPVDAPLTQGISWS